MARSLEPAGPSVSVVIPTIGRPDLVIRAVRSALDQSVSEAEVVVVVDGPDDTTVEALAGIEDRRVRVRQLNENGGLGAAISAGVAEARAPWVALLDDDDEWLPRKLEVQLAHARRSKSAHPIVACRFIARTGAGDLTWPRRRPDPGEPLSEYFFCQRGPRGGEGVVLPSSIMTTRALLERVPFRVGLPRLNDYDWLLRAVRADGAGLEFVALDDPLVIYHRDESRGRLSTSADWHYCRTWLHENRDLVTQRAWAGFLLTVASMTAARAGEKKAFFVLLWDAFRQGRPSSVDLMAHFSIWLIPWALRTRVAVGLGGDRRSPVRWLGDAAAINAPEVREICAAIRSEAPDRRVSPLRAERGKKTFRVVLPSGAARGRFVVKQYGARGPLDAALLRHLRPGPGQRVPRSVEAIRNAGVLTARLRFAAFLDGPKGSGQLMGMEEIEGAATLRQVLAWLPTAPRARLFSLLGRAVSELHRAGIFHFDLNEDNLLWRFAQRKLEGPYFVDLDYTVRASPRRRWLCRTLARLDLHQLFTIRNAEITDWDRRMLEHAYRSAAGPLPEWAVRLDEAEAAQRKPSASEVPPLPRRRYPRWKRRLGTSLVHLFRGALLVARVVR